MLRFKLQTIVSLLGLAVGMTCFTLGTLWLRYVESFEDFVPDAENIYITVGKDQFVPGYSYLSQAEYHESLSKIIPSITDHCFLGCTLFREKETHTFHTESGDSVSAYTAYADSAYIKMFGIEPIEGSLANYREGDIILTESVAKRFFGDKKAVGQQLMYQPNSDEAENRGWTERLCNVVAVIRDQPSNTQFDYELLLNMGHYKGIVNTNYKILSVKQCRKHCDHQVTN